MPEDYHRNSHPKRLILHNDQAPGDVIMLTAAVLALHETYPSEYLTDVRTCYPALWMHNTLITPLDDNDPNVTHLLAEYPLIHSSNVAPYHFLHGFIQFLEQALQRRIPPKQFKGDIRLSPIETKRRSAIHQLCGSDVPFWIINAGGKFDYTTKWWDYRRYQDVVTAFQNRVCFVQIGDDTHHHPPLEGVIDLRGKTTLRELINLTYHAQGVLCPVTMVMHLAAALPCRADRPRLRPCVVVAGGREPPHWEAYPHHQFIHNVGSLSCNLNGGCWRARTIPLNDRTLNDLPENLCLEVVLHREGKRLTPTDPDFISPDAFPDTPSSYYLPRCMDLITAEDVIKRIEIYFAGGANRYLSKPHAAVIVPFLT